MNKCKRNVRLYVIYSFFSSFVFHRGIFILFLLQAGLSNTQVGTLQAVLFVSTFIFEIPTGLLGDKIGRKTSLLLGLVSLFLFGVGMIFCSNYYLFLILFIIKGVGFALISGSGDALLYDSMKLQKKEGDYLKVNSYIMSMSSITLGVAIVLGGFIKQISWDLVYLLYVFAMLVSIITVLFLSEVPTDLSKADNSNEMQNGEHASLKILIHFINTNKGRSLLIFIFSYGIYESIMTPYFVYSQNLFNEYELTVSQIGIIFSIVQFISGAAYLLSEKLLKMLGMVKLVTITLFSTSALLLSNYFHSLSLSIFAFFVLAVLPEIIYPVMYNYIQERTPTIIRASVLSVYSFIHCILIAIAYMIISFMFDFLPVYILFSIISIVPLISLFLLSIYFRTIFENNSEIIEGYN